MGLKSLFEGLGVAFSHPLVKTKPSLLTQCVLLLLPDFQEWISIGSSGQSTKKSMQTWERTKKPKDESGKKWKHKGEFEGLQFDPLVGF